MSTLVNQLVAKGYLRREPSPSDRRAAVLTATDAGTERLDRWADERVRLYAEGLGRLEPDEVAALRAALPVLRRIADSRPDPDPGSGSESGSGSEPEPQGRHDRRDGSDHEQHSLRAGRRIHATQRPDR